VGEFVTSSKSETRKTPFSVCKRGAKASSGCENSARLKKIEGRRKE